MANLRREHVDKLLKSNYSMYESLGKSQGMPDGVTDYVYVNAMSHTLFDLNQKIRPIGVFGSLTGNVAKFKKHAMFEMVPFSKMSPGIAEKAFTEYVLFTLYSDESADVEYITSSLESVFAEMPSDMKDSLLADAKPYDFPWLSLIQDTSY